MSRQLITLKTRVRYEGRATISDRRSKEDTDFEKLPDATHYFISQLLRSKFKPITQASTTSVIK